MRNFKKSKVAGGFISACCLFLIVIGILIAPDEVDAAQVLKNTTSIVSSPSVSNNKVNFTVGGTVKYIKHAKYLSHTFGSPADIGVTKAKTRITAFTYNCPGYYTTRLYSDTKGQNLIGYIQVYVPRTDIKNSKCAAITVPQTAPEPDPPTVNITPPAPKPVHPVPEVQVVRTVKESEVPQVYKKIYPSGYRTPVPDPEPEQEPEQTFQQYCDANSGARDWSTQNIPPGGMKFEQIPGTDLDKHGAWEACCPVSSHAYGTGYGAFEIVKADRIGQAAYEQFGITSPTGWGCILFFGDAAEKEELKQETYCPSPLVYNSEKQKCEELSFEGASGEWDLNPASYKVNETDEDDFAVVLLSEDPDPDPDPENTTCPQDHIYNQDTGECDWVKPPTDKDGISFEACKWTSPGRYAMYPELANEVNVYSIRKVVTKDGNTVKEVTRDFVREGTIKKEVAGFMAVGSTDSFTLVPTDIDSGYFERITSADIRATTIPCDSNEQLPEEPEAPNCDTDIWHESCVPPCFCPELEKYGAGLGFMCCVWDCPGLDDKISDFKGFLGDDLVGTATPPPVPEFEAPPMPNIFELLNDVDQNKPAPITTTEDPNLSTTTFDAQDVKDAAPEIPYREDESGGFDIVDPLTTLPDDGSTAPRPDEPLESINYPGTSGNTKHTNDEEKSVPKPSDSTDTSGEVNYPGNPSSTVTTPKQEGGAKLPSYSDKAKYPVMGGG